MIEYDLLIPVYKKYPIINTLNSPSYFKFGQLDYYSTSFDINDIIFKYEDVGYTFSRLKDKFELYLQYLPEYAICNERRLPVFEFEDLKYGDTLIDYEVLKTIKVDKNIDNQDIVIDDMTYQTEYRYNDDKNRHELILKNHRGKYIKNEDEIKVRLKQLNNLIIEYNKKVLKEMNRSESLSYYDLDDYAPIEYDKEAQTKSMIERIKESFKRCRI